jgi:GDP-L-fucose synthase
MIHKFHEAKGKGSPSVEIWGTGTPRREFLYVDDLADACVFLMQDYAESEIVNIGVGSDITIKELALLVKEVTGFHGELLFNAAMPDGTPRKLLDVSKLKACGWFPKTSLQDGIIKTYDWFRRQEL